MERSGELTRLPDFWDPEVQGLWLRAFGLTEWDFNEEHCHDRTF